MSIPTSNLEPPSLSEVVRLINGVIVRLDSISQGMVTQVQYSSDKEGITLKFNRSEEIHVELAKDIVALEIASKAEVVRSETVLKAEINNYKADVARVEKHLKTEVDKVDERLNQLETSQKEKSLRYSILFTGAALTAGASLAVALLGKVIGA